MDSRKIREIISKDKSRRDKIIESRRYYENENDIRLTGVTPADNDKDPLRNADNRISHNFHQLLVDEKAAYMFTYPVLFNLDNNKELNTKIRNILGDWFESISKELCIEASNCGVAWIHYWIDGETNNYEYAIIGAEEIIPSYGSSLKKELKEVYRYYESVEDDQLVTIFEHWREKELDIYTIKGGLYSQDYKIILVENIIHTVSIPFVEFKNNTNKTSDLSKYKDLIDLYDKVMSGFANDLEDIQQIIYVLENYGGEDLKEFLGDLKRFKAIKTDSADGGGAVKTLQIEIPVEARTKVLDILKKQIYESGQGLQQDVESVGNASGTALKFFYRKLELKSGNLETEFKKSFTVLIRSMLSILKIKYEGYINQTYTRNMISNDFEIAQIAQSSFGVIPRTYILRNHPWIDDPEEAEALMEEEEKESEPYKELDKAKNNE